MKDVKVIIDLKNVRKILGKFFCLFLLLLLVFILPPYLNQTRLLPPMARMENRELINHEHQRIDPFYWFEENHQVSDYIEVENQYFKTYMAKNQKLINKISDEIDGRRIKQEVSVPYKQNGYLYYSRLEQGNCFRVFCRKKDAVNAQEEILLDVPTILEDTEYTRVGGLSVSPDNSILAYSVTTENREFYTILFQNIKTGKMLDDKLEQTRGYAVWAANSRTVFYAAKEKIYRHYLGEIQQANIGVYTENEKTATPRVFKTSSKDFIVIASHNRESSEYRICSAHRAHGAFNLFWKKEEGHVYDIDHIANKFYIRTNFEAQNFRLMETTEKRTAKRYWQEVIPHRDDIFLAGVTPFKNFLVLHEYINCSGQFRIINLKTNKQRYIYSDQDVYHLSAGPNPNPNSSLFRFKFSSLTTPAISSDYDMRSGYQKVLKKNKIPGKFRSENYYSERLWAYARDETRVPVSVVYRTGLIKNGSNPLLLEGNGAYGNTITADFNPAIFSLLDRGFIYAIAHVRGGQALGPAWHEQGKLLNKKNSFNDFISCAEFLINEKYTSPDKLFVSDNSAGGLLMGVVLNKRPDLFRGVIAHLPFVDVLTTVLDKRQAVNSKYINEWGDPKIKKNYHYLLSYSPYDNIKKQDYPAMLVTTGYFDYLVPYTQPLKWVAKLRANKTDNNPLIIWTYEKYGHYGKQMATPRDYAFILGLLK